MEADRPVVVPAVDRIGRRPPLGMALDAGVVGVDVVEAARIDDGLACPPLDVLAPWPMAAFATHVPFGDRLGMDVVVDRVATIAKRAGRALEVVGRVKRRPPIGAVLDDVRPPRPMDDVPLRGKGEIVASELLEVALLPDAAIDKRYIVLGKMDKRVGLGEVRDNGVRMLARVTHNVGHRRLLPAVVDAGMARLAGLGSGVAPARREPARRAADRVRGHRRSLRQIPHVKNELPDLPVRQGPGRHACVPDAVA